MSLEKSTPPDAGADSVLATPALGSLGVIRAQGEDAAKFLHSQLTQDFSLLDLKTARLAGFCSAKGRLMASFIGFKRAPDDILLVCSRDLLPATLKRLSMFVLRAKLKLSDASDAFQVRGLAGTAPDTPAWRLTEHGGGQVVSLYPSQGLGRALWVAEVDTALPAGWGALDPARWDWLEVMSGIAPVTQPIIEAFVPQMLNYESVGGVNFKKGCYPGQEVVARSQFRGTLKRRAYLVSSAGPLAAGQEVFHSSDTAQPCGTVAAAAAHPDGGWNAIVSMQTSAATDGTLHAGEAAGPSLTLLPLPYPLVEDV